MRTFLEFVRRLAGVQEMEERVAKELPSAIALSVEPRREWVLALWLQDLTLDGIITGPAPAPNQPAVPNDYRLLHHPWWESSGSGSGENILGKAGWGVLRDASYRTAVGEWLQARLDFPNLDYERAVPSFQEGPEERLLMRIIFPRLPKPDTAELNRAREIIAQSPVPCVIEFRAKPRLALEPGSSLAPPGTAGGFVRDGVGRVYAVTCGHVVAPLFVAGAGDRKVRDRRGEVLGEVVQAVVPVRSPPGHVCARPRPLPNAPPPPADPSANLLDVALVQLTGTPLTTGLRDLFNGFDSGMRVQMVGATSGTANYAVRAVNLWTKFPSDDQHGLSICFQDLFQLGPIIGHWAGRLLMEFQGPRVASLTATVPERGDSGAWITSGVVHSAPDWLGMLVGVDDNLGYAIMSDVIFDWVRKALNGPVNIH